MKHAYIMKILILGSEGFVGHNLISGLKNDFILTASDIHSSSNQDVKYVKSDVTKFDEVKSITKDTDIIINLAAHTLVSSFDQVIVNAKINIIGMLNVLESARINNVQKIIFSSASSLIGDSRENLITEKYPANPKTAYGVSKMACEHYLRIFNDLYGLNYVTFRFFNIYGPHQINGLIPSLILKLKKNQKVTVFGEGDQIRDYVYIEDAVPFFKKAIKSNVANNKILNFGTGIGHSVMDVINVLSKHLDTKPKIDFRPSRQGEISNFVADTRLLNSIFGSIPNTTLETGLSKTLTWHNNKS